MRRAIFGMALLACLATTTTFSINTHAAGADAPPKCNSGPKARWTPSDKLSSMLALKGFKVRRIGDMAGCYVVVGTNAKGEEGEFFFHPLTLGQVGSRLR